MTFIYKEWLRLAYQKEDPSTFLYNFLCRPNHNPLTVANVMQLFTTIKRTDSPSNNTDSNENQDYILKDIELFKKKVDEDGKPHHKVLAGHFCYFATLLTHIWVNSDSNTLIREQPIIAYVTPNIPIQYVWFNIDPLKDTCIDLIKHTFDDDTDRVVRVIAHIVKKPGDLISLKLSFDLETQDSISTMRGDFMQIAVRLDTKQTYLQTPCKHKQCLVILTYNYVVQGMYYNNGQQNTVSPCYYSIHYC